MASAAVRLAQSQVGLDHDEPRAGLIVRGSMDGEILQLNLRLGQYAAFAWKEPGIVLGDIHRLHVRVYIDGNDLPYFSRSAEAVATLKGRPPGPFPSRICVRGTLRDPQAESDWATTRRRVDTRVLQVIYELPEARLVDVYVGQQMDVYLQAARDSQAGHFEIGGTESRLPFQEVELREPVRGEGRT